MAIYCGRIQVLSLTVIDLLSSHIFTPRLKRVTLTANYLGTDGLSHSKR